LEQYGACFLKNAISRPILDEIREAFEFNENTRFESARTTAERLLKLDPNVSASRYTFGRLHLLLRGTIFDDALRRVHSPFLPLVYDFFPEACPPFEDRIAVTEVQLVITEPMALAQVWHMDNGHRGLTVMIPLEPVRTQGLQKVLLGSHRPAQEAWEVLLDTHGPIDSYRIPQGESPHGAAVAPAPTGDDHVWDAGEALIMDSRLLHRGESNESAHEAIPILVIRYDLISQMPPGQRPWDTRFLMHVGRNIERVFHGADFFTRLF